LLKVLFEAFFSRTFSIDLIFNNIVENMIVNITIIFIDSKKKCIIKGIGRGITEFCFGEFFDRVLKPGVLLAVVFIVIKGLIEVHYFCKDIG
jgi:hypothetical protein